MAKKEKFHFNPETLNFERIEFSFRRLIKIMGIYSLIGISVAVVAFFVISKVFPSPFEKQLIKENEELKKNYLLIDRQLDEASEVLNDLRTRDNNMYRVILQADPISIENRDNFFENADKMSNSQLTSMLKVKINNLSKEIYSQSKSYDQLLEIFENQTDKLLHIPAIQPVMNKDLSRVASGYGYRKDPIYNIMKLHTGMDFTAPTGTAIFATGKGVVEYAGWKQGYGKCVIINHGYNYKTFYAHMSSIKAKQGQSVGRGEVIGLIGSTGKSTGPHLHYEVLYKNRPQDPRNYYILDLSPEQYDQMISLSENYGNVFD